MFKSIFLKYFTAVALIISSTLLLLTAAQAFVAGRYWISEKRELLTENAHTVGRFLEDNAVPGPMNTYFLPDTLSPTLGHLASVAEGNVLVTDSDFRVLLCSDQNSCSHIGKTLPEPSQTALQSGDLFVVGRLGGLYDANQYTAGVPLKKQNTVMGYVLVSAPTHAMQEYITDNLRVSLLSGVAVLMVMFVVLYLLTYRMVRPLRQMAVATRQFSRGDFSVRVRVRGQDEVAQLANALNSMAVSLSSEEEMRRSFIANVSHELKTPMTTIAGFIDGILDGTIPPEKHAYYLQIVSDEVKRLSRLVRSMLDLSRIDSGQLQLHPVNFDLTESVCTVLLSFEQQIEKKNLTIEGLDECEPRQVNGDYDLLRQAVYNLLENAVKFTNENGTITVRMTHKGGRTFCTIRNTGDGIPSTELSHIFERFYKSDRSRGLDKTGTGLGLYLVKSIINLHNGEITVRSVEGNYCEFTFWIPDGR